jgi:hypothetical protein
MKKQLVVALGLTVLATPAFASKARLQALGEDTNGSFYVNDNRNIFLNAANINNHKDLVTFEWGDTTQATDSTTAPRAEGGFFKSAGNLNYGVQLGSQSNTSNGFRAISGVSSIEENNIDVFVGGDAGLKWGANVTYSKSEKDETASGAKQDAIRTRLGVIAGDIEGYANISIANHAQDANSKFKGNLGYQVGAIYNLNDYRIFADYRSNSGKANGTTTGATDGDLSSSKLQVGAGRATKLNDKATLFTKAQFEMNKANSDFGAVAFGGTCGTDTSIGCKNYNSMSVPVVAGLEYDAASWLTLRSSVSQTLWGTQEVKSTSKGFAASTAVNAGASLKFGEMTVDGVIGNSLGGAAVSSSTSGGTGNLRTDNLMSRVSMTYRF